MPPEPLPVVLIPGLLCSPRLYGEQLPELWRFGPLFIADHTRDDSMAGMARRILAAAPPRFALAGLSMGGYAAFEIMRASPERVVRLALLDTSARADTPEASDRRRAQIALARSGRFGEVIDQLFPGWVHRARRSDESLRRIVQRMAEETGPEAFTRQVTAIMTRPDSRPGLAGIRCPTLVLVGDGDEATPPDRAAEMANGIAAARLVTISECGHLSPLERPEHVTRALVDWLQA
ncbi:MAG: alpha/beta fold hydrolase [Bacillati bacterium ANGP1]|uniref:Alpha/beta fold hydrolase n=1 Tax=Candidatus Segetimicrobium genomatis TaxID=2569760 RepID=A0A537KDG3_9BACT|nr:MAG: alpha/beta fold hydrolase [Terrabacteria group bacterium ANGP1]